MRAAKSGRRGRWGGTPILILTMALAGCAPVITARSAEVPSGLNVDAGVVLTSPPGDPAAWFWMLDCEGDCNAPLLNGHIGASVGVVPDEGVPGIEIGAGFASPHPYVEVYFQLARGGRPFGFGGRFGLPTGSWRQDAFFVRYDARNSPSSRTFLNATIFRHSGASPSGFNPGSFLAFAPGVGYESRDSAGGSYIVSVVGVLGRTRRELGGYGGGPPEVITGTTPFVILGLALSID